MWLVLAPVALLGLALLVMGNPTGSKMPAPGELHTVNCRKEAGTWMCDYIITGSFGSSTKVGRFPQGITSAKLIQLVAATGKTLSQENGRWTLA